MDRQKLLLIISALLETLEESKDSVYGGAPESHLWLGCQSLLPNLDAFQSVLSLMIKNDLCTNKNHLVEITVKGSSLVAKIKEAKKEAQNEAV